MKRREFIGAGVAGAAGVMVSACSGKEQSAAPAAAPPPPKFRAIARFSGLFGVVTSPGFDRAEVLFVNGPKVGFPNHLAILKAHQDNVTGAAPAREDEYDPTIGIWEIKQSQVSFGVAGTLQKGPAAGVPCPTNPSAWRDPSWIPSLTTVLGAGKAQVHPDLVKPGDLSSTIVDTRIALAAGVLGASQPTDRQARKMKFEMVGATGVPVRPVSDVVELDMPDITSLTITITPYTGSPTVLTISAPASGRPVYLWFENHTDPDATGSMANHFRALYGLLKNPPTGSRPFPGNAVDCVKVGPPHDFPNYCPPAMLEY